MRCVERPQERSGVVNRWLRIDHEIREASEGLRIWRHMSGEGMNGPSCAPGGRGPTRWREPQHPLVPGRPALSEQLPGVDFHTDNLGVKVGACKIWSWTRTNSVCGSRRSSAYSGRCIG